LSRAEHVTLRISDARGRFVRTLIDGFQPAGPTAVAWDGRDDSGKLVGSGVYVCRLDSGGESATIKLALMR
jgi:flagellar basal-body rod modification protein FlgD